MIVSVVFSTSVFFHVGIAAEEIPNMLSRKIMGGRYVAMDEFLSKTNFIFNIVIEHNIRPNYQCGAILIARSWMLTAAHCVTGVGVSCIQVGPYAGTILNLVENVVIHPQYDGDNNNIALLHLNKLVYTMSVKIATTPPPINTKCTLFGKGQTGLDHPKTLYRSTQMQTVDVYTTRCVKNKDLFNPKNWGRYKEKSFLCTSTQEGRGACIGDTGGALLCEETPGKYTVVGILSNRIACTTGVPDIYTDVSFYNKWIHDIVLSP